MKLKDLARELGYPCWDWLVFIAKRKDIALYEGPDQEVPRALEALVRARAAMDRLQDSDLTALQCHLQAATDAAPAAAADRARNPRPAAVMKMMKTEAHFRRAVVSFLDFPPRFLPLAEWIARRLARRNRVWKGKPDRGKYVRGMSIAAVRHLGTKYDEEVRGTDQFVGYHTKQASFGETWKVIQEHRKGGRHPHGCALCANWRKRVKIGP